jgi:hypothetical protein
MRPDCRIRHNARNALALELAQATRLLGRPVSDDDYRRLVEVALRYYEATTPKARGKAAHAREVA